MLALTRSDDSLEADMRALAIFLSLLLLGAAAYAAETITYTYDARGRLKQVAHSGTINNGVSAAYTYDKADNRANVTVTGAGASGPAAPVSPATTTDPGTATDATLDPSTSAAPADASVAPPDSQNADSSTLPPS
jgi:hypothetical protein